VSAVKGTLAELKVGMKLVEEELLVAMGVAPAARGRACERAATHQDFGQLMASFHESASSQMRAAEVCLRLIELNPPARTFT
jgi:hypothetical protein